MFIGLVAAMSENGVIGYKGEIPWKIPRDLRRFAKITMNHPVIMGRKTYESIKIRNGGPLPDRYNIVLSRKNGFHAPGCEIAKNMEEALWRAQGKKRAEVFIIGGSSVYKEALPIADTLYFTIVHKKFDGDVFFPEYEKEKWEIRKEERFWPDSQNPFRYTFLTYRLRVGEPAAS